MLHRALILLLICFSIGTSVAETCIPHLSAFLKERSEMHGKWSQMSNQISEYRPHSFTLLGDSSELGPKEEDQLVWLIRNAGFYPYLRKKNTVDLNVLKC